MSKLIALVATAVIMSGERTVIQPGQELPELSAHDARELVASGAAQDPGVEADQAKADKRAAANAQADFQAARKAIQEANASTDAAAPATKKR